MEAEKLQKEAREKILDLAGEVSLAVLLYRQVEVQKLAKVK